MSETATVMVKEVKRVKEGTNAKGKWTMYGLVDGNDDLFSWFNNSTLFDDAKKLEDHKAEIEFKTTDKGRNLTAIKPAEPEAAETPPLGTGEYVKGQSAPNDAKRILLCVAWERAVELAKIEIAHAPAREWSHALIFDMTKKYAYDVYVDLLGTSGLLGDEDFPF